MIKIAIAGSSGLAQYIAHFLSKQANHPFILLSRNVSADYHQPIYLPTQKPKANYTQPSQGLISKGWQVVKVDYNKPSGLRYALAGVDTVISTISGAAELSLINAAAEVHVRRFVPSEFEGMPSRAPTSEILDRGNLKSLARLQHYQEKGVMDYTVFVCGIFYERFAPGGMAAFQIGCGTHVSGEGEYLLDIRRRKAEILSLHDNSRPVWICMTSAQDVARSIVSALDQPEWPAELRMYGDRMALTEIVTVAENVIGNTPPPIL